MPRLRATRLSVIAQAGRVQISGGVFAGVTSAYVLRIPAGSTYSGPLIRVRRSTDNAMQDFGVLSADSNGNRWLDTASILLFVGAGSGFVSTWYDASGAGRHATQSDTTRQPRIVNAGVLDTDGGRPTVRFLQAASTNLILPILGVFGDSWSANAVVRTDPRSNADWSDVLGNKTTLSGSGWFFRRGYSPTSGSLAANVGGGGTSIPVQQLGETPYPHRETVSLTRAPNLLSLYTNNSLIQSDATITPLMQPSEAAAVRIGGVAGTTRSHEGSISEVLIFPYALSDAERIRLSQDQGTVFGITVA
jgi:hypothetical protein